MSTSTNSPTPNTAMAKLLQKRPSSPTPTLGRSSFSSVRERDSDYTQSFTSTKVSSYIHASRYGEPASPRRRSVDDVAVADEPSSPSSTNVCDASQESVKERDSLPDLGSMQLQLDESYANLELADIDVEVADNSTVQPLERLPPEIFNLIAKHMVLDTPPNGIDRRNVDLMSLLVTSRSVYARTLETVYRRVTIPHSRIFQKFLAQIEADPIRGTLVRRLDFSHFNPVSLFSTASERQAARNLTCETLLRCLNLTPNLNELLVQDYIDEDLSADVLLKVFTGLPNLKALDLCGSSSAAFRTALSSIIPPSSSNSIRWPAHLSIQRLSLHKCISLPPSVLEFLLPKLDRLTHLDVAGTQLTDSALRSISPKARLTHLNLAKCSLLTADTVLDFLAHHAAVNHEEGLAFLSLSFDAATSQLLGEEHVSRLLPQLPPSLKSLSLKGSKMNRSHLPQLRALSTHLEELALGRGLTLGDISSLVVPVPSNARCTAQPTSSLRYVDLTDVDSESFDLSYFYLDSQILSASTTPLEVLEISEDVAKRIFKTRGPLTRMGWRQSEIGARTWLVRGNSHQSGGKQISVSGTFSMENGQRPWKMGAQSWGMRKIPVANAKVGGMYGSYMFGRKL